MENQQSPKGSPLFLYLSLFMIAISLAIYYFGNYYVAKQSDNLVDSKIPSVERARIAVSPPPVISTIQPLVTELLSPPPTEGIVAEHQRQARLFFVTASENGRFNLKGSMSQIAYEGKQELTATIRALIVGPSRADQNKGSYSMIPEGTVLLGASVKDGVAYLNFNENFRFNSFGLDGYNAQLDQIIYTATEFSTVKSVQFLIDGEEIDYLSEGINIKDPLTRH